MATDGTTVRLNRQTQREDVHRGFSRSLPLLAAGILLATVLSHSVTAAPRQASAPADSLPLPADSMDADSIATPAPPPASDTSDTSWTAAPDTAETDTTLIGQVRRPPFKPLPPPDTTAWRPTAPTALRVSRSRFSWQGYKNAGQAVTQAPGLYPRQADLYAQPFYPIVPGGNGRDLTVLLRNRPYGEPATDATNFSTFAVEEILSFDITRSWTGWGPSSSGPVMRLNPPHVHEKVPETRIVYRQGFYGLGHADWRIAQRVSRDFEYHFGLNIGEYRGRYTNTAANTSILRLGGEQRIRGVGWLRVDWQQVRLNHGRPFERTGDMSTHREDVDLILAGGRRDSSVYRELGLWYVRSQRGYSYGDEDGNRIGGRLRWEHDLGAVQRVSLEGSVERTAARFTREENRVDPHGARIVAGLTAMDEAAVGALTMQGALRLETASYSGYPDSSLPDLRVLLGGSFTVDWGDSLGAGLLGEVSSSWRWPSLDEAFGYYDEVSPDRWMDATIIGDSMTYEGHPGLSPTRTRFIGGGPRWRFSEGRQVRLMAGVRHWVDPILAHQLNDSTWTRRNGDTFTAPEVTASGWAPVWGPFSFAGSFTWTDAARDDEPVPTAWGWGSLRYENRFYNGQLTTRFAFTAHYYDSYNTPARRQPEQVLFSYVLRFKIFSLEAFWGGTNLFSTTYQYLPGFPNMHRGDIWGVRWHLLN